MYLKRGKNRNNELELSFLALDNLEQGIAICDENFKPLIHNVPMLYHCQKFMGNMMKKKKRRRQGLPKEVVKKLADFKKDFSNEQSIRKVFKLVSGKSEFFLTVKSIFYHGSLYFLLLFNEKRIREADVWSLLKSEYRITERESQIINLVRQGFSNRGIGEVLKVSPATIKTHLRNIFKKTSCSTRAELIGFIDDLKSD